jgi:hypothetical protein
MFGFKKKFLPIDQYPDTWTLKAGTDQGLPIIVRTRTGFQQAAGHPEYPFQIGVAVPLLDPTENGLPGKREMAVLDKVETKLVEVLSREGAVLVLVITTGRMREFVFYARDWRPEELDLAVQSISSETIPHEIQFIMQHDPTWSAYKAY